METSFWHQRWQDKRIGFHASLPNQMLVNNFGQLNLTNSARIFVPLCGKSLDMAWLLSQGYNVVGAELSQIAIEQLFDELGVEPQISNIGNLKLYSHENIDIYVGDIFELTHDIIGQVDGIYDRAALVALPEQMRIQYANHLIEICNNAPQFLVCFEYDQSLADGPPFSVDENEVQRHYGQNYRIKCLEGETFENLTRSIAAAVEHIYLLSKL